MTEKTVIFPVACRWWRRPLTCCVVLWCRKLDNTSIRRTTVLPLFFNYPVLIFQNTSFILFLWYLRVTFLARNMLTFFFLQSFFLSFHTRRLLMHRHTNIQTCASPLLEMHLRKILIFIILSSVCARGRVCLDEWRAVDSLGCHLQERYLSALCSPFRRDSLAREPQGPSCHHPQHGDSEHMLPQPPF